MNTVHCAIATVPGQEGLAEAAFKALQQQMQAEFCIHWFGNRERYDAIVIPATADGFDASSRQIARLKQDHPSCGIVALCDQLSERDTAALLGAGVLDFVCVPYCDTELRARVRRVVGLLDRGPRSAPTALQSAMIGNSPVFLQQLAALPRIAASDMDVLILGETGTGKEVCAQAIHYTSGRAKGPWVAVNCGAIPAELTESELFGHVRGAFTSAHVARAGLVREAEGGTLFLDEIDSLPYGAQAKLLRFLQEKEYRPVGGNAVCHADVRIIAACNRNLQGLIASGTFRQDLYFRLKVLGLNLPPLRERREDIPRLALHFLDQAGKGSRRRAFGLAPQALKLLLAYDWPGNVRELKHVIERAVVFADGELIRPEHLDLQLDDPGDTPDSFRSAKERVVNSFERGYIEHLLRSSHGNITQAAQAARKNRRAFFELMRKHHIEPQHYR
ncbi:MAG TPA: sigma-54 dependent transcriptional regulator [Solimonas sp.]|nr:sigma-54 dependent transcriptional regulator [Solimonas sp.]